MFEQINPIDVSGWTFDEVFGNYPEGAREKKAFFPPLNDSALPAYIKRSRRYLYKHSDDKYPDQFWGEIAAYQIGKLLKVQVPPAYASFNSIDGNCGALIEWFYEDGKASFVAGGQYMQRMMPEFDRRKGELHNFQSIRTLGRLFMRTSWMTHDWMTWWHEAALFDALIGNTDRHQDNWGILIQRAKKRTIATLAPLFDNGTSLGHELFTCNVAAWTADRYQFYMNRGTHHMRWEKSDAKKCRHLDLLERMQAEGGGELPGLRRKLEEFDLASLEAQLAHLCQLEMRIPLTQERKKLYIDLVTLRRERILKVLK